MNFEGFFLLLHKSFFYESWYCINIPVDHNCG